MISDVVIRRSIDVFIKYFWFLFVFIFGIFYVLEVDVVFFFLVLDFLIIGKGFFGIGKIISIFVLVYEFLGFNFKEVVLEFNVFDDRCVEEFCFML